MTSISKNQFESILKTILNDYMRIKNENEVLRKQLEIKTGAGVDMQTVVDSDKEPTVKKILETEVKDVSINYQK